MLILMESWVLSSWCTTLGKSFLKIKIYKNDTDFIPYKDSFIRTVTVWIKELGLGIPIIYYYFVDTNKCLW